MALLRSTFTGLIDDEMSLETLGDCSFSVSESLAVEFDTSLLLCAVSIVVFAPTFPEGNGT